jgi:predicted aspartyl protease
MIDARINGHPKQALLDSAAEATILDQRFAQTLKLGGGQAVSGQGSGQGSFEASLVDGVSIEALGLSLTNQTVAVADLGDVGRRLLKRRLDVILGRELFDAARLSIDIEARRIAAVGREREPAGVRLGLVTEHGVETIPVQVEEGAPVRATFDLGNGSHVLLSKSYAQRLGLGTDGRAARTERGGGLGGETTRQVYTLRSISIAGRRFTNVQAAIDPQPSASDVNVGVPLLRHFRITTDYASHAVWLQARE